MTDTPGARVARRARRLRLATTLDIAPSAKQALLELRSEPARLDQFEALFADALRRIKTATPVAEQASGDGYLRPGE